MVSITPFLPGLDFSYKYNPIPLPGNVGLTKPCPGSLWAFLLQDNDFSIFRHLVVTAEMVNIFNDLQANFTVLVPSDSELLKKYQKEVFLNMGKSTSIETIKYNTLNRKITYKDLTSSDCMKINTLLRGHVLYSKVDRGHVVFNDVSYIIRPDVIVNNCLLHITNDICIPEYLS